jgi:hypothetical protein
MRDDRAPQIGIGIDHRAHQLAARRAARDADAPLAGEAALDQPLRHIDEIVEGVGALVELAVEIPLLAQIVAAADMRDGIGKAAVEQESRVVEKPGSDRDAIGAIAIEVQRPAAVFLEAFFGDDRDRNFACRRAR